MMYQKRLLLTITLCLCGIIITPLSAAESQARKSGSTAGRKPLIKDFMGINFHTFQVEAKKYSTVAGLARDYHPYVWDTQGNTSARPPYPMSREKIRNGKAINWKEIYSSWQKAGFKVDVSLTVGWTKTRGKFNDLPKDVEMFGEEFARFFGPSGENRLVEAFEIGNEPTAWKDDEYRQLFKHMAKGLRKGDPKLKIVTCTASALKPDRYEKPMSCFTGLEDFFDAINLHTYSLIQGWPTWERSYPEDPGIRYLKTVKAMIAYRNKHPKLRDKEIWITEFGYDACSEEARRKPRKKPFEKWIPSTELEQAQWLIRSFLIFSSMDVNRAYMYWFDDKDTPSFHACSGITRNGKPKKAFYAMQHMYQQLGDYRFSKIITEKAGDLYIYQYEKPGKLNELVWVIWSPTKGKAASVRTITNLPGKVIKAEVMPTTAGKAPVVKVEQTADGAVKCEAGESPVFIFMGK